jgi:hypothetical protein
VETFPASAETLKAVDLDFQSEVAKVVGHLITYTRQKRTPLAEAWRLGLPVFITGGGAECEVFRGAVALGNARAKGGLEVMAMPKSSLADGVSDSEFHRVSVAFGLTFDKDSLGRVIAEKDLEDFLATRALPIRQREDRDEKYAK